MGRACPRALLNQLFALKASFFRISYAVPWNALDPPFVEKLRTPPVVWSYSAGNVDVRILNSRMDSTDGPASSKDDPFSARRVLAPSSRISFPKFCPPPIFEMKMPLLLLAVRGPVTRGARKANASGERKA